MNVYGIDFSNTELKDLIWAFIILTICFTILCSQSLDDLPLNIPAVMVGVGLGSILHEIANKLTAMHYGYWAEFKISWPGLVLGILTSFAGFTIATSGSVYVYGINVSDKEDGMICLAGSLANFGLAALFLVLAIFIEHAHMTNLISNSYWIHVFKVFFNLGFISNGVMAFFNSLPFDNLDGAGIFKWNPIFWFILIILIILMLWQGQIFFNNIF